MGGNTHESNTVLQQNSVYICLKSYFLRAFAASAAKAAEPPGPVLIWGLSAGFEQTNGARAEGDPAANDISQLGQNKVAQSVSWDNGGEHI